MLPRKLVMVRVKKKLEPVFTLSATRSEVLCGSICACRA